MKDDDPVGRSLRSARLYAGMPDLLGLVAERRPAGAVDLPMRVARVKIPPPLSEEEEAEQREDRGQIKAILILAAACVVALAWLGWL